MNHPEYHGYAAGTYRSPFGYETENPVQDNAFSASRWVLRTGLLVPPEHRLKLFVLALTFATGLYAGALLFDRPSHDPATVIVCPGAVPGPVAVLPAECRTQGADR
ncbi:hypothetical protein [Nocardia sp. NPDC059228]|uniref:hypothetical protein n=1 Tax=Nocardia sp. NPDC059228 TaxID=3346777 RepID=UPI0036B0D062